MTEFFKAFKHLSREVYIYIIPGLILLINFGIILFIENQPLFFKLYNLPYISILLITIAFVLGHFSLSIREPFLCKKDKDDEELKNLINVFQNNKDSYEHFVERYNLLYSFRKNMFCISILMFITNIIALFYTCKCYFLYFTIFSIVLIVFFLIYAKRTKEDYKTRIKLLSDSKNT